MMKEGRCDGECWEKENSAPRPHFPVLLQTSTVSALHFSMVSLEHSVELERCVAGGIAKDRIPLQKK